LSTSTPILFGRSFTWPSEAMTRYCLPRYLLIVFAFAAILLLREPWTLSPHFNKVLAW
jgi:hypothetical protein